MSKTDDLVKPEKAINKKSLRNAKRFAKPSEGDFAKELERLNDVAENTNKIILYVILILSVMVATMLLMVWSMVIDANNRKIDSNNFLIEKISELNSNTKINALVK